MFCKVAKRVTKPKNLHEPLLKASTFRKHVFEIALLGDIVNKLFSKK
jgi:hypothetical protein